jgi:glycerol-3-phosphate acyltransferase PlsY
MSLFKFSFSGLFLSIGMYLLSSLQLSILFKRKKMIKFLSSVFFNALKPKVMLILCDSLKCLFLILIGFFVGGVHFLDVADIALIVLMGHYFPIWHKFYSNDKNFMAFILVSLVVDTLLGLSMIVTFLIALRQVHYYVIAIMSAMLIAFVHTLGSLFFHINYHSTFFFAFFSLVAFLRTSKHCLDIIAGRSLKKHAKLKL